MANETRIRCWFCKCDVFALLPRKVVAIIQDETLSVRVELSCLQCYERTKDKSRSFNGLPCVVDPSPAETPLRLSAENIKS